MNDTITIPRATVQQALDALETGLAFSTHSPVLGNLRTALEQQAEPAYDEGYKAGWSDAQPRQQAEPVAWMAHQDKMLPTFHRTFTAARDWADNPTPLYTAPPQRKPLTDEEIEKHWKKWVGTARPNYSYTRAIEQAHGIKEGT